jgi:CDP-2,3-bis-(O-geranylgeranyl)-sn-glycerol synthase
MTRLCLTLFKAMIHDLIFSLWFLLPAGLANMAPIFAARLIGLRRWDAPIDGGRLVRGEPVLGPHKTWRGLLAGMVVSTGALALQQLAVTQWGWAAGIVAGVSYANLPTLVLGPLLGFGALGGDAVASYFKRRAGKLPGQSWVPLDQLDYVIGAILVTLPFLVLPSVLYIYMLGLWFGLHLAASYIGFRLGLKEAPI